MKVIKKTGREDIAIVYIAETGNGELTEFVESLEPPLPRLKKWVLIVSTLYGCPVKCKFCDANYYYRGRIDAENIIAQIEYMVKNRFPDGTIPCEKFKIQFARMGEPAFNNSILDVLEALPTKYNAPGLMPCISTIAPSGKENFFARLLDIKKEKYPLNFQLQFSIHATDTVIRDRLIPVKKWDLREIADYGSKFFDKGGRKIALNFAGNNGQLIESETLVNNFSPDIFLLKLTPINPTYSAQQNNLSRDFDSRSIAEKAEILRKQGFEVLISEGVYEENNIGSNCGQYIQRHLIENQSSVSSYTYELQNL